MKKRAFVLFLLILSSLYFSQKVSAEKPVEKKIILPAQIIEAKKIDPKARILADYLARFDSPLQYHAQDFLEAARTYGLDWKLLPSIAGVESTFGKRIPGGFNAWGWGVYGNQAIYFTSWKDGIFTIAKGLREGYLNKGLTDPYAMNKVYAASPHWGGNVTYFMQDLEKFAASFESDKKEQASGVTIPTVAVVSGQIHLLNEL